MEIPGVLPHHQDRVLLWVAPSRAERRHHRHIAIPLLPTWLL